MSSHLYGLVACARQAPDASHYLQSQQHRRQLCGAASQGGPQGIHMQRALLPQQRDDSVLVPEMRQLCPYPRLLASASLPRCRDRPLAACPSPAACRQKAYGTAPCPRLQPGGDVLRLPVSDGRPARQSHAMGRQGLPAHLPARTPAWPPAGQAPGSRGSDRTGPLPVRHRLPAPAPAARREVMRVPERLAASTTTTPRERPLMMRLRTGKFSRRAGVPGANSETSRPFAAILSYKRVLGPGYGTSMPVPRTAMLLPVLPSAASCAALSMPQAMPETTVMPRKQRLPPYVRPGPAPGAWPCASR